MNKEIKQPRSPEGPEATDEAEPREGPREPRSLGEQPGPAAAEVGGLQLGLISQVAILQTAGVVPAPTS